jgi:hypothetical protein
MLPAIAREAARADWHAIWRRGIIRSLAGREDRRIGVAAGRQSHRRAASSAKQDLAESQRRASTARTPAAKAVTRQVAEKKKRTYSGRAARETAAQIRRSEHPLAAGSKPGKPAVRRARATKKGGTT